MRVLNVYVFLINGAKVRVRAVDFAAACACVDIPLPEWYTKRLEGLK